MKVAIDKNCINKIEDLKQYDYVYIFDDEQLQELIKLEILCINKNYIDDLEVDINLTDYKIDCFKKANIEDKNWNVLPEKENYKFAVIVPNYNNDHRRL